MSGLSLATYRAYDPIPGRWLSRDPLPNEGGTNLYEYANNIPILYSDPQGDIAFVPMLIGAATIAAGAAIGYGFDYLLDNYRKQHCRCGDPGFGAAGNSALGGAMAGSGPFGVKDRMGIAGGGQSGTATSFFSQANHWMAQSGWYNIATRNAVTRALRTIPEIGLVLAGAQIIDAMTCQ